MISSVFNNKTSLVSNENNLKQSKNSSTLSIQKNQKEPKNLTAVAPYVDDKYLNEIADPIPQSTNQKNVLAPDAPNIKHYYENVSKTLKNSSSNLHNTSEQLSSDKLNTIPENANAQYSFNISFETAKNAEISNNSSYKNGEDFVSKNLNAQIQPNSNIKNEPKQISFNQDNYSQKIIQKFSDTNQDLNLPKELKTLDNCSKNVNKPNLNLESQTSNSASIQNFASTSSQKSNEESINIGNSKPFSSNASFHNYKQFSNIHTELIPENNLNFKQIETSYPENVCSNSVSSKFISPQNYNNLVVNTCSEINNPKSYCNQNTCNNVTFISPQSNNSTISKRSELDDSKNTDIYKPEINFEQSLRSQSQTNSLNNKTSENRVSVRIPDREPSFECEQGNVPLPYEIDNFSQFSLNNCPNFPNLSQRSKSGFEPMNSSENIAKPFESFDKVTNIERKFKENELISDEEEANSSLTVETSDYLDTSLNSEEIAQPTKKIKYDDDHEMKIPHCQDYRHKKFDKFGKLSVLPEADLNPQSPSEKLSCFKQSKKQLLPKTPKVQILSVENVQYPNVSSLITSPRENTTKTISWRSPLTSEIIFSTPNSSCSSSDVGSPMTMTKLDAKYPNTIRIKDYKTSKVSTAHSVVKIDENPSNDIHKKMTYVQEYVVREIQFKQTIDHSSVISKPKYSENGARKKNTSSSTHSVNSSGNQAKESSNSYNSIQRNSGRPISLEQKQALASNSKLEFNNRNNIHKRDHHQSSSSDYRKNEKLPQMNRIPASSGAVINSPTFKTKMKNILSQLSDKGATEALTPLSQNNNLNQELFIPSNIQDYSVRSDFSVSDYKTKSQEIFYSKRADAIYKKSKLNVENLSNDINNNKSKDKQKISSNENIIRQETCEKGSYSLFKNKEKSKKRQGREPSNEQMSFNFNPTSFIKNRTSNSIEPVNMKKVTTETYAKNTYFVKDSSNLSYDSGTFFDYKNSHEYGNKKNPLNYSGVLTSNRNRNIESRHTSNYIKPVYDSTIENPNKIASSHSSGKNMVRLQDGPLVDLNEVNQLIEKDSYDLQPMDAHPQNLYNLSPKSFIQTLKSSVPETRFNSSRFNLF
ncbi:putative uncharacterized protein DDB_G0282133 [Chrysoperla carnea]|uniref:putative uncharacterized protein DDB_G0282133 n=1 Tax=Chrysoperla carnea TaxID=189513 RepID=UPI001D069BCE|nr:putative uncharacterized protein DDB_G0282133 [Chrysoperla carnea]